MMFTDHQFHNNGLAAMEKDLGRYNVTHEDEDKLKFKTPSLRNIALTAPYMHDGRFKSLEEVVAHYNTNVERSATLDPNLAKHPASGLGLTADEQQDLVAFLNTLTDETLTRPSDISLNHE
jgi:cytochrome c peroxidase